MSFALSPGSPIAILETRSISSPSITLSSAGAVVVLRQHALETRIRRLDRGYRLVDQFSDCGLLGVRLKVRPARFFRNPEQVLGEVLVRILGGGGVFRQQ